MTDTYCVRGSGTLGLTGVGLHQLGEGEETAIQCTTYTFFAFFSGEILNANHKQMIHQDIDVIPLINLIGVRLFGALSGSSLGLGGSATSFLAIKSVRLSNV